MRSRFRYYVTRPDSAFPGGHADVRARQLYRVPVPENGWSRVTPERLDMTSGRWRATDAVPHRSHDDDVAEVDLTYARELVEAWVELRLLPPSPVRRPTLIRDDERLQWRVFAISIVGVIVLVLLVRAYVVAR